MKDDIDNEKLKASVQTQAGRIRKAERARRTLLANTIYLGTLGLIFVLAGHRGSLSRQLAG